MFFDPLAISCLHTSCNDRLEAIVEALGHASALAQLVLVTGGLGPTQDDLTREALAAFLGVPLEEDAASLEHIAGLFRRFGRTMSPSNRRQALLPQGARVLKNEVGTAPAFAAEREGVRFYALPGVPREARWLWRKHLQPELSRLSGSRPQAERTFRTVGLAESSLSECLAPIEAEADVEVRYAAEERLGTIRVTLLCREEARAQELWLATQDLIGKYQVALGSDELPEAALGWLHARRLSLATAESCTGGRVAAALTSLAGASAYFKEGMVTYSNQAKTRQLGVPLELLEAHGAVSPEVARAMAQGARAQANADLGLGITGIAGPGGGSPEKPVGLVYLTLAGPGPDDLLELERRYPGTRTLVQTRATAGALGLLVRSLAGGG